MVDIELGSDEVVILDSTDVGKGGFSSSFSDELVLTNHSIVCVEKGIFGRVKNVQRYQLNNIKIYNGLAQAIASNPRDKCGLALTVYFLNYKETFFFSPSSWKELREWVESINELLTGVRCGFKPEDIGMKKPIGEQLASIIESARPVAEGVGGQVSGAFEAVKGGVAGATSQISSIAESAKPVAVQAVKTATPFAPLVAAAMLPNNRASEAIVDMMSCTVDGADVSCRDSVKRCNAKTSDENAFSQEERAMEKVGNQAPNTGGISIDQQIEIVQKLKALLDAGILSQEEFDAKKKEVMGL